MRRIGIEEIDKIRRSIISEENILLVKNIINDVIRYGDEALIDYSKRFDNVLLDSLRVSRREIEEAYSKVDSREIEALEEMKRRVMVVEKKTLDSLSNISIEFDGIKIERELEPIESVGCYIPGGKARYASSVIMCIVPAKVAGVDRIIVSTPSSSNGIDPLTLVASDLCEVDEIYKVGGAHAIAAMAYGSKSIKPVDKIVGPGGVFVTLAKYLVSNRVSIDMLAGPTELIVLADETADARLIAYDLIAQAEHSRDTLCGLVTTSTRLAERVEDEIATLMSNVERREIIRESLTTNGFIMICNDMDYAIKVIDIIAPEHLEIFTSNADEIGKRVRSAGLILTGEYSSSLASDYCFGTNHVLPTLSFARSRGSLSCLDFLRLATRVHASEEGLKGIIDYIKIISKAEGLPNHAKAVEARL